MKEKIALAMSGGVDSSVSAFLLKEAGFDVSGFFMRFWSDGMRDSGGKDECHDAESLGMARKVADNLGIPFRAVDVRKAFKEIVVDDFIAEYAVLRTPNPCIGCNRFIKFGWFLEFARSAGFDRIATGHYVRTDRDGDGVCRLFKGKDESKDQSYFLHRLSQDQLSHAVFPVGGMSKKEVTEIAGKNGMNFDNKRESQEICFIRNESYREFLARHSDSRFLCPGEVVDSAGNIVGRHEGLAGYTIGQRKGIEYSGTKDDNRKPLYVTGFDKENNRLVVGTGEDLLEKEVRIESVSWISDPARDAALGGSGISAKIRYRHPVAECSVRQQGDSVILSFADFQKAPTPGQYAVLYKGDEVLGGGVIAGRA